MALLTPAQTEAELQRKARSGELPTDVKNMPRYNEILAELNKAKTAATPTQNVTPTSEPVNNTITGTVTNVSPAAPTPVNAPMSNPYQANIDLINSMYDQQYNARADALRKARDTALQGLNSIETGAKQTAVENRNAADATNMQNAQRLREAMANMGLLNSGDNLTNIAGLNAQKQAAMGQINQQEANVLNDVAQRRASINDNAASDEQALMAELNAARANALLQNQYRADDNAFRDKQFNAQQAQQQWDNTFKQGQFDYQKASDLWEQTFKEKSFDQSVQQFAAQMGYNYAQLSQHDQQFVAEMAFKEKAQSFSQQMQLDQFNWQKDPNNPDNVYRNAQINALNNPSPTEKFDQLTKDIDSSRFVTKDSSNKITVTDQTGLENYILSMPGLTNDQLTRLYTRYGIPMK